MRKNYYGKKDSSKKGYKQGGIGRNKTLKCRNIKMKMDFPKPKEAIKIGISLSALGLGIGLLNKYSGGN